MDKLLHSPWFGYAIALAATALATLVRWELDPWLGVHLPYTTYLVAIIVAGWVGGWRPAALSAVLSLFASLYLFVPPRFSFGYAGGAYLVGVALYAVAATLVVAIIERMHAGQHRAQRQLLLWQTTVASIGDAVLTTDAAGNVTFLNAVAERLTGWSNRAAAGRPHTEVLRIVDERSGVAGETPVARALRTRQVAALGQHRLLVAKGGGEHPIDDSAAPIRDEDGAVCGAVLVFRDISERRRDERARDEAQAHVISTLESIPDAFIRVDPDWRIGYVNKQYERNFGRPRERQLGKVLWEEWPELLGSKAEIRLRRAMSGREVQEFEDLYAPSKRWFAMRACPTANGDLAVFIQDVTDRRQAEEALRASEQRFRMAAEAVNGLIYDYHVATGVVERSGGLYDVLGYRPEEVPATADWWWAQIHPDDLPALQADCAPGTRGCGRGVHVYRARHKDGRYVWLSDRSLGVQDEQGRLVRQVGCTIDITAVKEAETTLKEADRRKDEFLATLAHELRNPLAPISNAVHFLKLKVALEPAAAWGLGVIERQAHNMARLLDDLLDVSRIARNKLVLRKQTVELAAVLQQALETSRPLVDMGGHELTVSLPPEPVELEADPMRLAQVFSNLLTNAAKYTPGGGHIRVAAARADGRVTVSVRDDGIGIAPDMLPRLFQIFSQAESALERSQGGLGIGLSLVRGLVELHGGTIEARSEGSGRGSEFIVTLPVRARGTAPAPAAAAPELAAPRPAQCRILIADDNRDGADSMAVMLQDIGHEVFVAYDGDDALALAELHRPDVALLDIGMPKKNGYDLCRAIRARPWGGDVVLIALTGWGQEEDRRRAQEAGFDHHLVKPVDVGALSDLLASIQLKQY